MKRSDYQLRILEKAHIECEDVSALLGDYADDDLMPSLAERVDEHYSGCESCRKARFEYLQVIKIAKQLRHANPLPKGVTERLQLALNNKLGIEISLS